jgi:cytochrome c oxidase assembly protein subunit 15
MVFRRILRKPTFDPQMRNLSLQRPTAARQKAVARWLLLGVAMLIIQIMLGGITRLTGSGLSITEWKPIMGAIPPLNEQDWQIAFQKYQQIAQYTYLNAHFTLEDFKKIFFWEWLHREWARIGLAVVFAVGFFYFLAKKYFDKEMVAPFIVLFILGGLQGAIGWIMVQSGLNDTDLYVSHIRLAIHFMAALLLLCYTLWFALKLLIREEERTADRRFWNFTLFAIVLLCIQLVYGAFMAGLKAAPFAPTWPTINGLWVPDQIHQYGSRTYEGAEAYSSHPIAVHFIHRGLAYLLLLVIIAWVVAAGKVAARASARKLRTWRWWPLSLTLLQVALGIFTVLHGGKTVAGKFGAFEMLALGHQLVATALLVSLIANLYLSRPGKSVA